MSLPSVFWPPGLHPIRGWMSVPELLVDEAGAVLIDTGFPGDLGRIRKAMTRAGVGPRDVRAILQTHGHIDHAGCTAALQAWTGAPVYAHPLEQAHFDGAFPYAGLARVCGGLEAGARSVTGYRAPRIDVPLADGDVLPFWGGLRVVHLPGHTLGHCGFLSLRHDLLFSGDLWVRFLLRTQLSPRIFTSAPALVLPSLRRVRELNPRWIVPGHFDRADLRRLKQRFEELCAIALRPRDRRIV